MTMKEKEIAKNVLDTFGMSSTPADVEAYMRLVAWCWTALLICGAVWGLYKLISFALRNRDFEDIHIEPYSPQNSALDDSSRDRATSFDPRDTILPYNVHHDIFHKPL